jgi:hypothetical protein
MPASKALTTHLPRYCRRDTREFENASGLARPQYLVKPVSRFLIKLQLAVSTVQGTQGSSEVPLSKVCRLECRITMRDKVTSAHGRLVISP